MNDIIPIRSTVGIPEFRKDTITELLDTGVTPQAGDFIRSITLSDVDEGTVIVSTPMFGRVRETDTHLTSEHPSITFRFDFGLSITLTGQATITWRPAEEAS